MSMSCVKIRELLSPYMDGELDGPDLERVEKHVGDCLECRGVLDAMRGIDALAARDAPEPGDAYFGSFLSRVNDRIDAEESRATAPARVAIGEKERGSFAETLRDLLFGTRYRKALVYAAGFVIVVLGGREIWRATGMKDSIREASRQTTTLKEQEQSPRNDGSASGPTNPTEGIVQGLEAPPADRSRSRGAPTGERSSAPTATETVRSAPVKSETSADARKPAEPTLAERQSRKEASSLRREAAPVPGAPGAASGAASGGAAGEVTNRDSRTSVDDVERVGTLKDEAVRKDADTVASLDATNYAAYVDRLLASMGPDEKSPPAEGKQKASGELGAAPEPQDSFRKPEEASRGKKTLSLQEEKQSADAPRILEAALLAQNAGRTDLAKRGYEIVSRGSRESAMASAKATPTEVSAREEAAFRLLCLEAGVPQSAAQGLAPAAAFARSVDRFRSFLREYPKGRFTTLATLYLGEGLYDRWKETRSDGDRKAALEAYRRYRGMNVDKVGEIYARTSERIEELSGYRSTYR